ncbi:GNAT family N-acetyltransferase [Nonomuraea sp. NBC_01738]|uniref:GNAT family N-acetyltransferase n=1 Tax=Nonomuraea sp. NBC_01738 TaxID=2976003 RepID=UPI002E14B632|nr:GNAT family N-acetyltransferase [Nonomuraea sp. NBC_01738]
MFDADLEIATERLTLRPFGPQDAERVRAVVDARVQFLPPGAPSQKSGVKPWLDTGVHELQRSGQGVHLAMTDADGRIVGAISLFKTSWNAGTTEVGYGVHPLYRGRGFAPEAVRALTAYVFERTDLRRIDLTANLDNAASLRVAEKAGFTREGVLRRAVLEDDGPHDLAMFGLLRGDSRTGGREVFPQDELTTTRLLLRRFTERDIPDLTATAADELTQLRTTVPRDYTEEHGRIFALVISEEQRHSGEGVVWAVEERDTGRFVLSIDLKQTDWVNRTTEVGYMTAPWARGNGYAAEAVLAVARWIFGRHGFRRLQLRAAVSNTASQRVAEKAGFTREGIARNGGHGEDLAVYSLIPSDLE